MNRAERIVDLKQRMVAKFGSCLIPIPEDTAAFPVITKDDTPEEREEKRAKKQQIMEARVRAYEQKIPEMIEELNKIIARVRSSRSEQAPKAAVDGIHSTSAAALSVFSVACDQCGNRDPNNVITDSRRGDRICAGRDGRGCGNVIEDHIEVQGADRRNHEGEDDKRQFGPAPNKLFGDAANMETSINIEVRGTGRDNSAWKRIAQAQQSVEMGLSSVGKDDKHTREGYKTVHKRKAFAQLEVIANDMNIHMQVVQRAKEEFAKYRDVMEAVHNFHGVLLACLVLAFEEVSASSSLFERIQQRYVPLNEPGAADTGTAFGRVRPRHEVTEDAAISTVPNVAMGKFSLDQVKEWLTAIAAPAATTAGSSASASASNSASKEDFTAEAAQIVSYVTKLAAADAAEVASRAARRELPQSSIFGTVTVSNRLKRYRNTSTTAAGGNGGSGSDPKDTHSKAGLHLLRVANVTAALHPSAAPANGSVGSVGSATAERAHRAETHFREAVIRRSQYDATLLEYERITALQQTRMRIEDQVSTNFQASVLQPRKSVVISTTTGSSAAGGEGAGTEESVQANKRIRTETAAPVVPVQETAPAATVVATAAVKVEAAEAADESFDFDLEELVGGKVATAASSKYANLQTTGGSSGGGATSSNGNGNHSSAGGAAHVRAEVHHGASAVGGAQVTVPGTAAAAAAAGVGESAAAPAGAGAKKVGMKPRPKFVIS